MVKVFKQLTRLDRNNTSFVLKSVHIMDMKSFSKKIRDFDPEQNDIIYMPPGTNIPSAKLKNFVVSHSIRRTNSLDKANTVVLSKENIYEYLKTEHYYILNRQELIDHLSPQTEIAQIFSDVIELLNTSDDEYVLVDYSDNRFLENHFNFSGTHENYRKFHIVESNKISDFEILTNLKIVSEASILKNINGDDSVEINQGLYEQLCNMLDSSDNDNTTMAMEIMANCHYMKSLPYLFLLFEKYSFKLEDSPVKRHVNFKSLLAMLDVTSRGFYMNINHMVNIMLKYNQVTKEKLDFLLDNLVGNYNVQLNSHNNIFINCLKFSELSIPDERLTKVLGYTYTYKIPQNGSRAD